MNDNLPRCVDAVSASPAIRARARTFARLDGLRDNLSISPPPIESHHADSAFRPPYDPAAAASRDGHRLAILIRLRQEASDEIERLLAFLDATDGDADLDMSVDDDRLEEDADDEPELGFSEPVLTGDEMDGFGWPYRSRDACQHETGRGDSQDAGEGPDDCDDEDAGCDEPSLGSVDQFSQINWAAGTDDEREVEVTV